MAKKVSLIIDGEFAQKDEIEHGEIDYAAFVKLLQGQKWELKSMIFLASPINSTEDIENFKTLGFEVENIPADDHMVPSFNPESEVDEMEFNEGSCSMRAALSSYIISEGVLEDLDLIAIFSSLRTLANPITMMKTLSSQHRHLRKEPIEVLSIATNPRFPIPADHLLNLATIRHLIQKETPPQVLITPLNQKASEKHDKGKKKSSLPVLNQTESLTEEELFKAKKLLLLLDEEEYQIKLKQLNRLQSI